MSRWLGTENIDDQIRPHLLKQTPSLDDIRTGVRALFDFGLNYAQTKDPQAPRLDSGNLAQALETAYGQALVDHLDRVRQYWCLILLQAFIMGQLVRWAWKKSEQYPDPNGLNGTHVGVARGLFRQATSPDHAANFIGTAYLLPRVNRDTEPFVSACANCWDRQIGQSCPAC